MSDDCGYLQYELDQERASRQRLQDEVQAERERRMEAARDRAEWNMRQAETWPEALGKQAALCAREAIHETEPEDGDRFNDDIFSNDMFFTDSTKACKRGLTIWNEVAATKRAKIDELQRQLAAVQDEIRAEVAKRLAAEGDSPGWNQVVGALENNVSLGRWLDW